MREKENFFIRLLKRLGIIVEREPEEDLIVEMCNRAIEGNICPKDCSRCAWGMMRSK